MDHLHRNICLFVACCVPLGGCSGDANHGTVSGTVTLDGQPLKSGIIRFVPADGRTASADAQVIDGKFSAKMPIGQKNVAISAPKVVGKRKMYDTPDSPTVDKVEELLPAQYNSASKLTLGVKPGDQTQDYELKGGK